MKNSIYRLTQTLSKIKIIALSRLRKVEEESFITERRKICETCPFNSINAYKVSLWGRILKVASDFYSLITFNKDVDVLGSCTICGCSLFYSTQEKTEQCSAKPPKWKSIKPVATKAKTIRKPQPKK